MSGGLLTRSIAAVAGGSLIAVSLAVPAAQAAVAPDAPVVINEVYGGGGNSGATLRSDFVELFNASDAAVSLDGWSVQYASATGNSWQVTELSGSIPAGEHYLVKQADGSGGTVPLPTPDTAGSIAMGGSNAKVALVSTTVAMSCGSGCAALPDVVDYVGIGSATDAAGTAAPAMSNSTSISRTAAANTIDNAADFTAGAPTPTNAAGQTATEPDPDPDPDPDPQDPTTRTIAEIQGTGDASPVVGSTVTTTGVVTAAYPSGGFNGLVIQTPGPDTTPSASDAVFVYLGTGAAGVPTATIGQHVSVTGTVAEFNGLTQIVSTNAQVVVDAAGAGAAEVVEAPWPTTDAEREALESMLFLPAGDFTVSNTYSTNQYGEVGLAAGQRPLQQPTDVARPGTPQAAAVEQDNAARGVVLDDGASTNFTGGSTNQALTPPYVSLTEPVRVGAAVTFAEPLVVDYRNNAWKLNPTSQVVPGQETVSFENTRTQAPDAERLGDGDLTLAAFNVLNYFTTLGSAVDGCTAYNDREGNGVTTRSCPGNGPRGAWDAADLERQQAKIVAAINALDADVVGLMEIENSVALGEDADEATETLVAALNADAGAGVWAAVPSSPDLPPVNEQDVITNAVIYRAGAVSPVGDAVALGDQSGPGEPFVNAREPIGQIFEPAEGGEPFLVVVNHFKSKGSAGPLPGDDDAGDGQGSSNASRMAQATALSAWVPQVLADAEAAGHPTDAVALVGDFNSYTQEDPLGILYDAGYANANLTLAETPEYSYSFSGLAGSLDHVLLNDAMLSRATGADIWNINAPESIALEYSRYNSHGTLFYEPSPFRSSDHDPVLVSFRSADVQPSPDPLLTSTSIAVVGEAVAGTPLRLTANVEPEAPGTIEFRSGDTVLRTVPTSTGDATITVTATTGTHVMTARFVPADETAYRASTSASATVTVVAAPVTKSKVSMSAKLSTPKIRYGGKASVKVTVKGRTAAPSGTVELRKGSTVIARGTLKVSGTTGTTTIRVPRLAVGKHRLTVHYAGSATTLPYTAKPRTLTVYRARSVVTTKVSKTGRTVWVKVRTSGSSAATGKVTVRVDGRVVGKARLKDGAATLKVAKPRRGVHVYRVTYSGTSQIIGDTDAKRVRIR